jgi:ribonuclease E
MSHVMPQNVNRIKLYRDDVPLFSRFQIEHQIESAYSRSVNLPSGGAVVFDHTEALVSIDVNSARSTRGSDIEETAFRTNLEAAEEIARQLRLRDLGGLIVIDFIDMESGRNQRDVENRLRDSLRYDRARVQTGKISRFGLMELSRQRLRPSLGETAHNPCPRCHGMGHIRGTESTALHILRIIQEEAMKENTGAINAQVPVDVATFLLNEKRVDLQLVEARHRVSIMLIPNVHLATPNYTVTRMRHDDLNKTEPLAPSYNLVEAPAEEQKPAGGTAEPAAPRPEAVVKGITPQQPAPVPVAREVKQEAQPQPKAPQAEEASIIGKIFGWFKRKPAQQVPPVAEAERPVAPQGPRRGRHERGEREGPRREREERTMQPGAQRPRQEQAQQPHGQREGGRHRGEQQRQDQRRHEPRRQEHPQQQRQHPPRDQVQAESRPPSQPQPGREHGEQQREGRGRRRRRGGRDRYEQRQQEGGGGQPHARGPQAHREPGRPVEAERTAPPPAPVVGAAPAASVVLAEVAAPVRAPDRAAPPPSSFETEQVREFAPREPVAAQPVATGPGFAPAEPVKIEWPSDLKQVESDPEKIQVALRQVVEEQPMQPRVKRMRPAAETVSNEPLVQIETQSSGSAAAGTEQKETAL